MPIEINEVHVRVTVSEADADSSKVSVPAGQQDSNSSDKVLAQSVEQVLEILRDKKER